MFGITHLVPARFLCIIAHLVVTITILWSRDTNVRACLPEVYAQTDYDSVDNGLLAGLILTLIFIAIELGGFMSGVTMFVHMESLFSTAVHASAAIALSFYLFEEWPCYFFWYIFGFCSAFLALIDSGVLISKICLTKSS